MEDSSIILGAALPGVLRKKSCLAVDSSSQSCTYQRQILRPTLIHWLIRAINERSHHYNNALVPWYISIAPKETKKVCEK